MKKSSTLSWFGQDQLKQAQIYLADVPGMPHSAELNHFALDLAVWAAKSIFNIYERDAAKAEGRKPIRFCDSAEHSRQCHREGQITTNEATLMKACRAILRHSVSPLLPHCANPLGYAFGLAEWAALNVNNTMRGWYERHDPEANPVHLIWEQMKRSAINKKGGAQ